MVGISLLESYFYRSASLFLLTLTSIMASVQFPLCIILLWGLLACCNAAASCSTTLTPTNSIKPTMASDYQIALIITGLTKPRSLQFCSSGNLLVVQQGADIINLSLQDNGGAHLSIKSSKNAIENSDACTTIGLCNIQSDKRYSLTIALLFPLVTKPFMSPVPKLPSHGPTTPPARPSLAPIPPS